MADGSRPSRSRPPPPRTSSLNGSRLAGLSIYGAAVFIGELFVYRLFLSFSPGAGTPNVTVFEAAAWLVYGSHFVPLNVQGAGGNSNPVLDTEYAFLIVVPALVCLLAGYLYQRSLANGRSPIWTTSGAIAVGYSVVMLLGTSVFSVEALGQSIHPRPVQAVVFGFIYAGLGVATGLYLWNERHHSSADPRGH